MRHLMLLAPLLLAACLPDAAPPPAPGPGPVPVQDACGAAALQSLVGQPASVLETMKFGVTVRVIKPGMAVTMDYLPERLNIWVNKAAAIDRVTCG